jgi:hypothetical protein
MFKVLSPLLDHLHAVATTATVTSISQYHYLDNEGNGTLARNWSLEELSISKVSPYQLPIKTNIDK